jgi:hypothetical protein
LRSRWIYLTQDFRLGFLASIGYRLYILPLPLIRLFRPFRPERLRQPKKWPVLPPRGKDPKGKIAKVWTGVNPNMHSGEVLGALGGMK